MKRLLWAALIGTGATATFCNGARAADLEANRQLVLNFWRDVLDAHDVGAANRYLAEEYIQHNPLVPTGRAGFIEFFSRRWGKPKPPSEVTHTNPEMTLAEGDNVMLMWKVKRPEPGDPNRTYDSFWFDVFRVKDGRIVEHWDGATK